MSSTDKQGSSLGSFPTSPPLYPHFNWPSGFWPCVKSCLVGGSDKYRHLTNLGLCYPDLDLSIYLSNSFLDNNLKWPQLVKISTSLCASLAEQISQYSNDKICPLSTQSFTAINLKPLHTHTHTHTHTPTDTHTHTHTHSLSLSQTHTQTHTHTHTHTQRWIIVVNIVT